ncbi:MAG TPA: GNAT family N-acetyltransferase [Solirubrobacterales bacterium]
MPVELRDTSEADLDFVTALEADPAVAPFIEAWSPERHRAALTDPGIAHLQVVVESQRAGFVILAGLANPNDCVELRRIVVDPPGRGLGRKVLALASDYASLRGAHRVGLDVKPDNARARRLYTGLGFEPEGILRDALKTDAGYESLILMAKLLPATMGERGFEPL